MKQVILILCSRMNPWILRQINKWWTVKKTDVDVYVLYHQQGDIPEEIKSYPYMAFTSEILHGMGYHPIAATIVPGSNHFPLLKFYLEHPRYDYYWLVEDDVLFTGEWPDFLDKFSQKDSDFVSAYVRSYGEEPDWPWWGSLSGAEEIPLESRVHSFNPIYRLSSRALAYIHDKLGQGWSGHHEVLLPTLLLHGGYSVADLNGEGRLLYDEMTHSHLPLPVGERRPGMIYHPVKEKTPVCPVLKRNCVIAAVGKDSLHREWKKGRTKPDFDLHLIVYDQSFNSFYEDADFVSYRKGYKMKLVYHYLMEHPEYLEHYAYFFIPDDDIRMDADNINKLFREMEERRIEIAQPGLSHSYYTFEHTLRDKACVLRYTNFVEIMLPCFSRAALKKVLHTFDANESGWGIEDHWPLLIQSDRRDIAVMDGIVAEHTRPIQSYSDKNMKEMMDYRKKYGLERKIEEYGCEVRPEEELRQEGFEVTGRSVILKYNELGGWIADNLLRLVGQEGLRGIGLDGYAGIAFFLAMYSRFSEKRRYEDEAVHILSRTTGFVKLLRNNMDFKTGLPGYAWVIEQMAQKGFVENNTDEVLEDVCPLINAYVVQNMDTLDADGMDGLARYYAARMKNPLFTLDSVLHREERKLYEMLVARGGRPQGDEDGSLLRRQEVEWVMENYHELPAIEGKEVGKWLGIGLKMAGFLCI